MSLADRVAELERKVKWLEQFVGCDAVDGVMEQEDPDDEVDAEGKPTEYYVIQSTRKTGSPRYYQGMDECGYLWDSSLEKAFQFHDLEEAKSKLSFVKPLQGYGNMEIIGITK